jgi:hypothetical protein
VQGLCRRSRDASICLDWSAFRHTAALPLRKSPRKVAPCHETGSGPRPRNGMFFHVKKFS